MGMMPIVAAPQAEQKAFVLPLVGFASIFSSTVILFHSRVSLLHLRAAAPGSRFIVWWQTPNHGYGVRR